MSRLKWFLDTTVVYEVLPRSLDNACSAFGLVHRVNRDAVTHSQICIHVSSTGWEYSENLTFSHSSVEGFV